MKHFIAAIAACAFHAAPAHAATLREYTPGGAPCAGACTLTWSAARFDVPVGQTARMVIPKGAIVTHMTYARAGVPYATTDSAVMATNEPGIGYALGDGRWMVRLDVCQNWAVVMIPRGVIYQPFPVIAPPTPVALGSGPFGGGGFGLSGGWNLTASPFDPVVVVNEVAVPNPDPKLPAVPLPASLVMILTALGCLLWSSKTKRA